jgi:hypothetical protein
VRRFIAALAAALVICFAAAAPASGQTGPRYIIVYGGNLQGQVVLTDAAANALLASAPDVEPRAGVARS